MGKDSSIEWTDHTFNPWIGCAKVSPGCVNCYAETLMDRRYGRVQWGVNGTRSRTSEAYWRQPLQWNEDAMRTGVRPSVFCGSLCDWLEDRPDTNAWRVDLLRLIEKTRHLDWLMLTKRPAHAMSLVEYDGSHRGWFERNPHVWFGVSIENQEQADKRIPLLLGIPARVRFLSVEPLLGPVDLAERGRGWLFVNELADGRRTGIHWVIVGGESGPHARPMHPDWARSIRDQCQAAGVPFFFKQWGEWAWQYYDHPAEKAGWYQNRAGKHAAGRLLDGREWNETP